MSAFLAEPVADQKKHQKNIVSAKVQPEPEPDSFEPQQNTHLRQNNDTEDKVCPVKSRCVK